ncbi:unnamed protein product [Adineta ricciae]|uniref:Uncharacterized protein n=1 Tax=Adineta ricciae TaxID=249248 RepID=A0A814RCX7_ADIRI|nr:unnamed protein product [Adineta ricciae]CAF1381873.1 unnamed protein product [Adineta ricciae]
MQVMFTLNGKERYMNLWILLAVLGASNALIDHLNVSQPVKVCPEPQLLCGENTCYDPVTQNCTNSDRAVQCINACGDQCYSRDTHRCLNGTLCKRYERLCSVKYEVYASKVYDSPSNQCYNPKRQACVNNTLCDLYRVCGQQCLQGKQLCINNETICQSSNVYRYYNYGSRFTSIGSCNGTCYYVVDEECVNNTVQCINNNNCSGTCYNSSAQKCLNGTLCELNEELCTVKYNEWGPQYNSPSYQCYNPNDQICVNNTLCYKHSVCGQQCLGGEQLCIRNKTTCNRPLGNPLYIGGSTLTTIESCNGNCYDSAVNECVDGTIQCINNNNCSGRCYDSSTLKCLNGTLCSLYADLCNVNYTQWGMGYDSGLRCYNPNIQVCLNNKLCFQSSLCDGQCLGPDQLCISNNKTVCYSPNPEWYLTHMSNLTTVESCNGTCYDLSVGQCVNNTVQCINNNACSGICYDPLKRKCFNGTLCDLDADLCIVKYDDWGIEQRPYSICYHPKYSLCHNNRLCTRGFRSCGQQCLGNHQICVNNNTICNVTLAYNNYEANQIQICNGVCYDTSLQQCIYRNVTISSTTTSSLPETTITTPIPSDYRPIWWNLYKMTSYIIIALCVVLYGILRLCISSPSPLAEKSILSDSDRIQLMKSDQF